MPFLVMKGTFRVAGTEPDGDTVQFILDDPSVIGAFRGRKPEINSSGRIKVRFEGIDALETHFNAKGLGEVQQPNPWADQATDRMLQLSGTTNIVWPDRKKAVRKATGGRGYILARPDKGVDKNKRVVGLVFSGTTAWSDGTQVRLDASGLGTSVNLTLAAEGLAYPIYYETLYYDLRDEFTRVVRQARSGNKGVWASDKSAGVQVTQAADVTVRNPVWPKLFRRITEYMGSQGGGANFSGFKNWLEASGERVWIQSRGQSTSIDEIVTVNGSTIGINVDLTDIIIEPK